MKTNLDDCKDKEWVKKRKRSEIKMKKVPSTLVIWCWIKKYPCKPDCQMYSLKTKECKISLVCNKILLEAK